MLIAVNGVRLFVEVLGPRFALDGPQMRPRRPLIAGHGGPGADHSLHRPAFGALSDVA